MDYQELLQKDVDGLMTMLAEKQAALREMRFKTKEGQVKNVKAMSLLKTEIAQIATAVSTLKKQA